MSDTATRTDPDLWETVKTEITAGAKGGRKGQWSARKAQLAVTEYRKRGGGYEGGRDPDNSLRQWEDEDWGTRSGTPSGESGERYLPKKAREALSDAEYRRTTAAKREDTRKGRQFSAQPEDVARKTVPYRHHDAPEDRSKTDLYAEARRKDVRGRSRMTKAELVAALRG